MTITSIMLGQRSQETLDFLLHKHMINSFSQEMYFHSESTSYSQEVLNIGI